MKSNTKILAMALVAAILVSVLAVFTMFSPHSPNASTLPPGEQPQAQVQITGNVKQEKTWTLKELTQLPLTNVTATIKGENATYLGIDFYTFCNQTGMQWDVGPVEIICIDGGKATLNIFQAYNSSVYPYYYNQNVILLAFAKNGQWLTNETGGPLKLVVPYFADEYQVEKIAEIHFKPWIVSITGKIANPLSLTSANLSCLQPRTVYAEFAPSVKRWSNWTGLPVLDILQAANISDRAEMLTVTAIDGYVKNYTLAQVEEGEMMLGYAENGNPLQLSEGGPYRLFAPTDKYKWAQFWAKFVCEIEVS